MQLSCRLRSNFVVFLEGTKAQCENSFCKTNPTNSSGQQPWEQLCCAGCSPRPAAERRPQRRSGWHLVKPPQSGTEQSSSALQTQSTAQILSPCTTSYSTGKQQNSRSEIQLADLQSLISIHIELPKVSLSHKTNC